MQRRTFLFLSLLLSFFVGAGYSSDASGGKINVGAGEDGSNGDVTVTNGSSNRNAKVTISPDGENPDSASSTVKTKPNVNNTTISGIEQGDNVEINNNNTDVEINTEGGEVTITSDKCTRITINNSSTTASTTVTLPGNGGDMDIGPGGSTTYHP